MACELCYCCGRPMNGNGRLFTFLRCNHRFHCECLYNTISCPCALRSYLIQTDILFPRATNQPSPHLTDQDSFLWNGVW